MHCLLEFVARRVKLNFMDKRYGACTPRGRERESELKFDMFENEFPQLRRAQREVVFVFFSLFQDETQDGNLNARDECIQQEFSCVMTRTLSSILIAVLTTISVSCILSGIQSFHNFQNDQR